jgi:hypothetical protein
MTLRSREICQPMPKERCATGIKCEVKVFMSDNATIAMSHWRCGLKQIFLNTGVGAIGTAGRGEKLPQIIAAPDTNLKATEILLMKACWRKVLDANDRNQH